MARGWIRFIIGPPSTMARATRRESRSRSWWLCSALATAERRTFSTSRAAARWVYWRMERASSTRLPRTRLATSRALVGETRMNRATAFVCTMLSKLFQRRRPLGVGPVGPEGPRRGELSEFVADHVLRDVHGNKFLPVVDRQRVADELRDDGGAAGPGLQDLLLPAPIHLLNPAQEPLLDVGSLFDRPPHGSPPTSSGGSRCTDRKPSASGSCSLWWGAPPGTLGGSPFPAPRRRPWGDPPDSSPHRGP